MLDVCTYKPAKLSATFPASKSRWDDLVATHQYWTPQIHFVAQFLPWHRLFMNEYQKIIREECL